MQPQNDFEEKNEIPKVVPALQNKQVVPGKWVEESFEAHVHRPEGRRKAGAYGYQFWLWQDSIAGKLTSVVACVGNGDQRIFSINQMTYLL